MIDLPPYCICSHQNSENNCVKTQLKIIEQLESPPLSLQPGMATGGTARSTPINGIKTCGLARDRRN